MKKLLKRISVLVFAWAFLMPSVIYAADSKRETEQPQTNVRLKEYKESGCSDIKKMSMDELRTLYADIMKCPSELYEVTPVTGENYKLGKLSSGALQHSQDYINFMRTQAGLPNMTLTDELNTSAQYGALTLAMLNGKLTPESPKPEYMTDEDYKKGYDALFSSNYSNSIGYLPENVLRVAIQDQIDDWGASKVSNVGHRRWLLKPETATMGVGNVQGSSMAYFTCIRVFGEDVQSNNVDYDFVSWPASGNMLSDVFDVRRPWSVTLNPSKYETPDFSKVKVEMTRLSDGRQFVFDQNDRTSTQSIYSEYFNVDLGRYGVENCIIFRPKKADIVSYVGEYEITISGICDKNGDETSITYKVNFEASVPLDSIRLDAAELNMPKGTKKELNYYCYPKNTTESKSITWSSSDESVATVANSGYVTAVSEGTAVITGKVGNKTAECRVVVTESGWELRDGSWYYYENGTKVTGWKQVGSTWYFMYEDGKMASDTWIGEYYVDENGAWITNLRPAKWIQDGNKWWYCNEDGTYPVNCWKQIEGLWYYFDSSGYMITGWLFSDGVWYYLRTDGTMAIGWTEVNGTWYYLRTDGTMAIGWTEVNGTWYYLRTDGTMETGWLYLEGNWYYLDTDGSMVTGYKTIGGVHYYFYANGVMRNY